MQHSRKLSIELLRTHQAEIRYCRGRHKPGGGGHRESQHTHIQLPQS